jgi:hypothetical protein
LFGYVQRIDEDRLPKKIHLIPTGKSKRGRPKTRRKKAYSELWKNVVSKMDTGRTDFVGDWVSKYVAIRHRTNTYIHTHIYTYIYTHSRTRAHSRTLSRTHTHSSTHTHTLTHTHTYTYIHNYHSQNI